MGSEDPLEVLGGTGLRVYLYMLAKGSPVKVREVQRALGFKSPSTAKHHLDRLVELGLAVKRSDGYVAVKPRSGLLANFVYLQGRAVPRIAAYAAAVSAAAVAYAVAPGSDPLALGVLGAVAAVLWLEAVTMLKALRRMVRA